MNIFHVIHNPTLKQILAKPCPLEELVHVPVVIPRKDEGNENCYEYASSC